MRAVRGRRGVALRSALRFRTLATEHFVIYFHQGEERLAAQLARIAEESGRRLEPTLGVPRQPRARTSSSPIRPNCRQRLGDAAALQHDLRLPRRRRRDPSSSATPTTGCGSSSHTSSRTSSTSIDRKAGRGSSAACSGGRRSRFRTCSCRPGRSKGWRPSRKARSPAGGRLHAGDFRAIEREAARDAGSEPLDRVNGGLTDWPDGLAPYAYGLGFHEYLVERFGAETLARWPTRRPRRLPFFTARERSRAVFGESLGPLWQRLPSTLLTAVSRRSARPPGAPPRRLTHHGYDVAGPRFLPQSCGTARARSSTRCGPRTAFRR